MVREENSGDAEAIRSVHDEAFGRPHEAHLVDRLRAAGLVTASVVAIDDGRVVGNAVFSRLSVETARGPIEAVALAPVAVVPKRQRTGIGAAMIEQGLRLCRQRGLLAAFVLGDSSYYRRFGFSAARAERIQSPYSGPHWMALEFAEGALDAEGRVAYPAAFDGL